MSGNYPYREDRLNLKQLRLFAKGAHVPSAATLDEALLRMIVTEILEQFETPYDNLGDDELERSEGFSDILAGRVAFGHHVTRDGGNKHEVRGILTDVYNKDEEGLDGDEDDSDLFFTFTYTYQKFDWVKEMTSDEAKVATRKARDYVEHFFAALRLDDKRPSSSGGESSNAPGDAKARSKPRAIKLWTIPTSAGVTPQKLNGECGVATKGESSISLRLCVPARLRVRPRPVRHSCSRRPLCRGSGDGL